MKKRKRALSPAQIADKEARRKEREKAFRARRVGRDGKDSINRRDEYDCLNYVLMEMDDWKAKYLPLLVNGEIAVYDNNDSRLKKASHRQIWSYVYVPSRDVIVIRSGYHPGRVNLGYIICKKGHEFAGIEVLVESPLLGE